MSRVVLLDTPSLYERHYCLVCDHRLSTGHARWCRGDGRVNREQMRQAVFERDGRRCRYCGSGDQLELDHVWPRSRGGVDRLSNLITACAHCNCSKGARVFEWQFKWEEERGRYEAACEDAIIERLEVKVASYG